MSTGAEIRDTMAYGDCTAEVTGIHRTVSGAAKCPVHGSGSSRAGGWTPRTPSWPTPTPSQQRALSLPPAPAPSRRDYAGQFKLIEDLSEEILELMLTDSEDRIRDAAFDLIEALTPFDERVPNGEHVLCELFEQVAVGLQSYIAAPGAIIDNLVSDTVAGSRIVAAAVRVLLKRAVQLATSGLLAPLVTLHLKACFLALAFCPGTNAHGSLERNCSVPLMYASLDPTQSGGGD